MPSCIFEDEESESKESKYLELDSSLARKLLNWQPCFSQKESIKETLDWWMTGDNSEILDAYTKKSVELFLRKMKQS